jgi:hypothetical protein
VNLYGFQTVSFEVGEEIQKQRYVYVEGGSHDGFITVSLPSRMVFLHKSHLICHPHFPCLFLVADQYVIDTFDEGLLLGLYACAFLK